jgi:hypothetical protein
MKSFEPDMLFIRYGKVRHIRTESKDNDTIERFTGSKDNDTMERFIGSKDNDTVEG